MPGALLDFEMLKKCTMLEREAHFPKSTCQIHIMLGARLEVEMLKKCTPLWHEAYFEVKGVEN